MRAARVFPPAGLTFLLNLSVRMANDNSGFAHQALYSHIQETDHFALATCNGFWNFKDSTRTQQLPRPASHWALPNKYFHDMIERNIYNNLKTVVVVPEHVTNVSTCLEATFTNKNSFYLVDWITEAGDGHIKESMEHATKRIHGKSLACRVLDDSAQTTTDPNKALIASRSALPFNRYSLSCGRVSETKDTMVGLGTTFRSSALRVACYHTAYTKQRHPCKHRASQQIFRALRFYNVTILVKLYVKLEDIFTDFSKGNTDILLDMCAVAEFALYRCSFSPPAFYTYETFYAPLGTAQPVSLFHITMKSKPSFYLVLLALVCALLVLATADILEFQLASLAMTLDSLMFLVASIFVTSSPIPNTRRWSLSRKLTCGVWLLAIPPLSSYIRSELTSRLTWMSPPKGIHSLDDLEHAIDSGSVSVCVITATAVKGDLEHNRTGAAIHAKLHSLYMERTKGTELVTKSTSKCISCARKENHICLSERISQLCAVDRRQGLGVVESTERLRPIFGASPMRKNYPFSRAYGALVRRVFEAPIVKFSYLEGEPVCSKEEASKPMREQHEAFTLFSLCLLGFLGTATAVLVAEIFISRCQSQKLSSDKQHQCLRQDQRVSSDHADTHPCVRRLTGPHTIPRSGLPQTLAAQRRSCSAHVLSINQGSPEDLRLIRCASAERGTRKKTATTATHDLEQCAPSTTSHIDHRRTDSE